MEATSLVLLRVLSSSSYVQDSSVSEHSWSSELAAERAAVHASTGTCRALGGRREMTGEAESNGHIRALRPAGLRSEYLPGRMGRDPEHEASKRHRLCEQYCSLMRKARSYWQTALNYQTPQHWILQLVRG